MVQLLKSRVYLYMENWNQAQIYAEKVIKNWDFYLTDLRTLPTPSTAEPYYNFIKMDSPDCIWVYGSISDLTYYLNIYVDLTNNRTQKFFNASPELLRTFSSGDLRKQYYVVTEYNDTSIYLPFGKYQIEANHEPGSSNSFGQAFRLAEAYLNLAELRPTTTMKKQPGKPWTNYEKNVFPKMISGRPMPPFRAMHYWKESGKNVVRNSVLKDTDGLIFAVMVCLNFQETGKRRKRS